MAKQDKTYKVQNILNKAKLDQLTRVRINMSSLVFDHNQGRHEIFCDEEDLVIQFIPNKKSTPALDWRISVKKIMKIYSHDTELIIRIS